MLTPGLLMDMLALLEPEDHSDDGKEAVILGDERD